MIRLIQSQIGDCVFTCSADQLAHDVFELPFIVDIVRESFGSDCIQSDCDEARVDRMRLREHVFRDTNQRKKLEDLIHPYVFEKLEECREKAGASGYKLFLVEVPLYYETQERVSGGLVVVVASSRVIQIKRLMEQRGLDYRLADSVLASQWPVPQKVERADVVMWNDGDIDCFDDQISILVRQLSNLKPTI